ncbi:thioredoxin family protein [Mycoplasmatota bacterium WC44]
MDKKRLEQIINNENVILFGYTSNCGTCKLAEQMLDIVTHTVDNVQVIKINLAISSSIVEHYKIKSTPSFILLKNNELFDEFYAFHSVTFLYKKINNLLEK